jgi:hypothetical protein
MDEAYKKKYEWKVVGIPNWRAFGCCTWGCCTETEKNKAVKEKLNELIGKLEKEKKEKEQTTLTSNDVDKAKAESFKEGFEAAIAIVRKSLEAAATAYAPSQAPNAHATSKMHELFYQMHQEMTKMEQEHAYMHDRLSGAIDEES